MMRCQFVQPASYVLYLAWSMSAASYASWRFMKMVPFCNLDSPQYATAKIGHAEQVQPSCLVVFISAEPSCSLQ
jgi:DNA-binding MurR/RpiR family transcriptional regulator